MSAFDLIDSGIETAALLAQVEAHPELWDAHPNRTYEASPHYGIPDIWLRWRKLSELTGPEKYNEPHFAEFYPAWHLLPGLHPIVFGLMAKVKAVYLGGILITKIPAGKQVKPHDDIGGWHAHFCNMKVYVPLQSNPDCVNYCADSSLAMQPGEAWYFDNLKTHSVVNSGATDRLTLICCFRVER
jgi:hypothetical protein